MFPSYLVLLTVSIIALFVHPSIGDAFTDDELRERTVEILNATGETIGTGFLITDKGHILTASHLITLGKPAPVPPTVPIRRYQEEKVLNATVLSISEYFDLALLATVPLRLPAPMQIGDSSAVSKNDFLRIVGHPAINQVVKKYRVDSLPVKTIDDNGIIFLNGNLFNGDSGGPVINSQSQVIGVVLKRRETGAEAIILPIRYAQHFLESCGIWIEQGRVAFYGSELELIKKQLSAYQSMYTFMTTDLKWSAEVYFQPKSTTPGEVSNPKMLKALKVFYAKRFPEQLQPKSVKVTVIPKFTVGIDKDKAMKNKLFASQVKDIENADTAVIDDVDAVLGGAISDYNDITKSSLRLSDVRGVDIEIVPLGGGIKFSSNSLSVNY